MTGDAVPAAADRDREPRSPAATTAVTTSSSERARTMAAGRRWIVALNVCRASSIAGVVGRREPVAERRAEPVDDEPVHAHLGS